MMTTTIKRKPGWLTAPFEEDKVPWWILLMPGLKDDWQKAYLQADNLLSSDKE
jgi:hypothetical protein